MNQGPVNNETTFSKSQFPRASLQVFASISFLLKRKDASVISAIMSGKQQLDPKYDNYDYPTISATNQSGHPGHTTPQQDAQVHQLRTQLEQAGFRERLDTLTLVWINLRLLSQDDRDVG